MNSTIKQTKPLMQSSNEVVAVYIKYFKPNETKVKNFLKKNFSNLHHKFDMITMIEEAVSRAIQNYFEKPHILTNFTPKYVFAYFYKKCKWSFLNIVREHTISNEVMVDDFCDKNIDFVASSNPDPLINCLIANCDHKREYSPQEMAELVENFIPHAKTVLEDDLYNAIVHLHIKNKNTPRRLLIFLLAAYFSVPYNTICVMTNTGLGTVKSTISRCKEDLRIFLTNNHEI